MDGRREFQAWDGGWLRLRVGSNGLGGAMSVDSVAWATWGLWWLKILWCWLVGEVHWIGGVNVMGSVTGVGCNSVRGGIVLGDWTYSNFYSKI